MGAVEILLLVGWGFRNQPPGLSSPGVFLFPGLPPSGPMPPPVGTPLAGCPVRQGVPSTIMPRPLRAGQRRLGANVPGGRFQKGSRRRPRSSARAARPISSSRFSPISSASCSPPPAAARGSRTRRQSPAPPGPIGGEPPGPQFSKQAQQEGAYMPKPRKLDQATLVGLKAQGLTAAEIQDRLAQVGTVVSRPGAKAAVRGAPGNPGPTGAATPAAEGVGHRPPAGATGRGYQPGPDTEVGHTGCSGRLVR